MENEKRLDLISRQALMAEYDRVHIGAPGGARKLMEDAPTVDAVEVVRCKDCKHLKYGYQCYNPLGMNLNNDGDAYVLVAEDDFCSYGERKDNG